jgi:hypothetical protein
VIPRALGRPALAAALVLGLAAGCAGVKKAPSGGGFTSRAFSVQGHGRLLVRLPPGWIAAEGEEGEAGVPAIRLTRPGDRFVVLLTPLWNPGEPESPEARADTAQLFAELGRRRALSGAVEREIDLQEISGPGVRGAYFAATDRDLVDREPAPDEYRHVLQGAAAVGPVIVAFTLLDDGPGAWRSQTLDVIRTARHVPDGEGADAGAAPLQPLPNVETVPLRVGLPGRSWAVLVDLPGFEVARVAPGGEKPDAMHVLGRSPESDVVVSVLLSPAGQARDAAGCREQALSRIRRAVAGMEDLHRAEGAGTAAATYALPAGPTGQPEWHAHAFLWRDGVCASLHASKAGPGRDDGALLDAILSSFRIAEDL